jgi:transcriptional regulator with XRE-family HTH domain
VIGKAGPGLASRARSGVFCVRNLDPGASPLHFFGSEVRYARTAAGMTLAGFAATVPCDASTVSRIEAGEREPTERFAVACDEAFPAMNGWFTRFWRGQQTWSGPYPPWFLDWLVIESRATLIRTWQPSLVPGLLQTPDYARAVIGSWRRDAGTDIEAKVAARIERQAILARADPPDLRVLLDESVLARRIGSPEIMRGQIDHLAMMGTRPNVTIQVVPEMAGAYAGLSGAFSVATVPGESEVAYLETAVQGMTVRDPGLAGRTALMFDDLRDEAFPRPRSLELISEAVHRWKNAMTCAGARAATAAPTAETASRSAPGTT